MPEGHTLHRLAGELTAVFGGDRVRVGSPQGRFEESAARLDGSRLVDADAWGKQLFVRFESDRFVHVHLGLYGTFVVHDDLSGLPDGEVPEPVGQGRLRLVRPATPSRAPAYADLRGATRCALVTAAERDAVLARIGPDPLRDDADPERAWARISRSSAPIGTLLMDQSVLAGVGNVYRAEVLFRHRIHPLRPGRALRRTQWRAIWDDLVVLMREGVRTGRIDTVRTEHTPEAMGRPPRVDDHGGEVYVYRRTGQACHVCGAKVRTQVLGGRNLFWCARCQPTPRTTASRSRAGR
ncbi:Fpg/Nei family DNA glycosylase [Nocardioides albidus]|uniref:DNA-(apurinic or apyrimidinic site) lyase n=1 Tax=Nocardioides albidus TaxID=1517589 RepID=A0A5C4VZI4_9ACTN|nr:DNA-formamidopyrimidine glycosylase family protein [Nocardioides albidus]TNM40509.1 Fpg/Nei family DNA glycosylase [Nocardioides albidus]